MNSWIWFFNRLQRALNSSEILSFYIKKCVNTTQRPRHFYCGEKFIWYSKYKVFDLPGVRSNLSIWSPSTDAQLCNWSNTPHGVVMATVSKTSVCGNVSSFRANLRRLVWPGSPSNTHTLSLVWSTKENEMKYFLHF